MQQYLINSPANRGWCKWWCSSDSASSNFAINLYDRGDRRGDRGDRKDRRDREDRGDRGDRGDRETYCPVSILLIMEMQFQPLLRPFFLRIPCTSNLLIWLSPHLVKISLMLMTMLMHFDRSFCQIWSIHLLSDHRAKTDACFLYICPISVHHHAKKADADVDEDVFWPAPLSFYQHSLHLRSARSDLHPPSSSFIARESQLENLNPLADAHKATSMKPRALEIKSVSYPIGGIRLFTNLSTGRIMARRKIMFGSEIKSDLIRALRRHVYSAGAAHGPYL